MHKKIACGLAILVLLWAGAAFAEETTTLYCIDTPWCCSFTCVMVDIDCKCYCPSNGPLTVEFLGRDGAVLGSFEVPNYCCLCDEYYATLDTAVNAQDVCSIRLRKPDEACECFWMALKVLCGDPCCRGKWYKVFKGDVWCWQPVPAPQPAPEPEPEVTVVVPPPADTGWETPAPEPQHDFDYFPPEQEEEEEVMVVEGRG
jgi:hypothetical protein